MTTMLSALTKMRARQTSDGPPSLALRIDRLRRAHSIVDGHRSAFIAAANADFGQRSTAHTLLGDLLSSARSLEFAIANVGAWMENQPMPLSGGLAAWGGDAWISFQPKGVVGIIGPWNYPVSMVFQPLAGALAAGNRAMLKPSEHTPATSSLLAELVSQSFEADELLCVLGDQEIGAQFAGLPFDHLFFTGSGAVGKRIMATAAEHLTPVTLELGGKSPAIIGSPCDLNLMADRIVTSKLMNSGQTCIAPDYLLVPVDQQLEIVSALMASVDRLYPHYGQNPHATTIAADRHYQRLVNLLEDAEGKGAKIIRQPADLQDAHDRLMPLSILLDTPETADIMRQEIFGPILPIITYEKISDAIDYIVRRPRPLALYYFGKDPDEEANVLERTVSGGVTINDVFFNFACEDLPFGGVGASGMGNYHGIFGFQTFSHARGVYRQPHQRLSAEAGIQPPYPFLRS